MDPAGEKIRVLDPAPIEEVHVGIGIPLERAVRFGSGGRRAEGIG